MNRRLLHLSDLHATTDSSPRAVLSRCLNATGSAVDAIVITGDLVQRDDPGAYRAVEWAVREVSWQVPVITVLGNHDDPIRSRALPGHERRHYRSVPVGGLRVITLDTTPGRFDDRQLAFLDAELSVPAAEGFVIAMHHPPFDRAVPNLVRDNFTHRAELAEVIAGRGVRLILAGHYHQAGGGMLAGVPVWVGPSLAHQRHVLGHLGGQSRGVDEWASYQAPSTEFSVIELDEHGHQVGVVALDSLDAGRTVIDLTAPARPGRRRASTGH